MLTELVSLVAPLDRLLVERKKDVSYKEFLYQRGDAKHKQATLTFHASSKSTGNIT
jgi:hypothetical protein